jgi:hypothetical protein
LTLGHGRVIFAATMETTARNLDAAPEHGGVLPLPIEPEMVVLRTALRNRHSVDHFARAWYGSLVSILLCGLWIKLMHDTRGRAYFLWPGALLCLAAVLFALSHLRRAFRLLAREREQLARLRALEAKAPPRPELF